MFYSSLPLLSHGSGVRIEHARAEFTAIARVTDNVTTEGMGIEFIEMELSDRAVLEKWLGEKSSP
jgi:hypothetical protein